MEYWTPRLGMIGGIWRAVVIGVMVWRRSEWCIYDYQYLQKLRCQKQHAELKSLYHGGNIILKFAYYYSVFTTINNTLVHHHLNISDLFR